MEFWMEEGQLFLIMGNLGVVRIFTAPYNMHLMVFTIIQLHLLSNMVCSTSLAKGSH